MPPKGSRREPPRVHLARGTWPDGSLRRDAPPEARYAVEICRRLRDAMEDLTAVGVATDAGVARSTLYDILNGARWPDMVVIAKLEVALNTRLWPD